MALSALLAAFSLYFSARQLTRVLEPFLLLFQSLRLFFFVSVLFGLLLMK